MPPKAARPKPKTRDQINVELTPESRAEFDALCADEAQRTAQSPNRVGGPLIRRLIREEYRRRSAAPK